MKKNYLIVSLLQAFIIIASVLLFPVAAHSQDLTAEQKQERCQNNKSRITELETELRKIGSEFSETMTEEEMKDVRDNMVSVRKYRKILNDLWSYFATAKEDVERMVAKYDPGLKDCLPKEIITYSNIDCLNALEKTIATKIDKAMSLNRPELLTKKAEIEKQIANHRNNLIALGCDDINKNNTEEFIKKLVGGWTAKPTPWGTPGGGCQIKYAKGKLSLVNEKGDESGASISLNSDGSAVINASKWPVSGIVDKAVRSIKWSNKSEWLR